MAVGGGGLPGRSSGGWRLAAYPHGDSRRADGGTSHAAPTPATATETTIAVDDAAPTAAKRHRVHTPALVSTLSATPAEAAKPAPAADVVAAESATPMAEAPLPAVPVKDEPTVVIHHEIYVVAEAEPVTVEADTATAEPESGLESLFAFGRSLGARLRAERLKVQGEARVALASL